MQRILIIEDDEAIAAIERDYLEIDGFAVEIAPDGESGLARGLTGQFDLILLDLMLPGLDGFAVCRRLRDALDIPILMVTARQEDIDKIRGLGLGADDYIEKPFSPQRDGRACQSAPRAVRAAHRRPARPAPDLARRAVRGYRHAPRHRRRARDRAEKQGVRAAAVPDAASGYCIQPRNPV